MPSIAPADTRIILLDGRSSMWMFHRNIWRWISDRCLCTARKRTHWFLGPLYQIQSLGFASASRILEDRRIWCTWWTYDQNVNVCAQTSWFRKCLLSRDKSPSFIRLWMFSHTALRAPFEVVWLFVCKDLWKLSVQESPWKRAILK